VVSYIAKFSDSSSFLETPDDSTYLETPDSSSFLETPQKLPDSFSWRSITSPYRVQISVLTPDKIQILDLVLSKNAVFGFLFDILHPYPNGKEHP
jgi:hypothetical protein